MNDKEFRQHLAELLARQRNPDRPAKKNSATPELPPKPATMSNKEFRQHIKGLLARQRNEDQPPPRPRNSRYGARRSSGSITDAVDVEIIDAEFELSPGRY